MQPAIRDYYRLEEIWGGKAVKMKVDGGAAMAMLPKASAPAPAAKKVAAKKAPATKTVAAKKAPAKVPAKKAPARKAVTRTVGVKQAPAKKTVRRAAEVLDGRWPRRRLHHRRPRWPGCAAQGHGRRDVAPVGPDAAARLRACAARRGAVPGLVGDGGPSVPP